VLRSGHPWLFAESILEQNHGGKTGDLAVIYDRHDRFLAFGLFDPDSPLRVRILHRGKPVRADRSWWMAHLEQTLARRKGLFDEQTMGFRWINGENDGWPGLVLDRYGDTLVLKTYTAAWLPRLNEILELLVELLRPGRIVLRLSRNIQDRAATAFARTDGQIIMGPSLKGAVIFRETGLRFEADVVHGQKTGFFLDQRENRRLVERLASGRDVLNAFSFSGGFSLYAARGGARSTTDVDISAHALDASRRNFALNSDIKTIRQCHHETVQADVFEWLAGTARRRFDLIILDPPSLAKRESERQGAIRAYGALASLGLNRLAGTGVLVACSCSAHVSDAEFFEAVLKAATKSRRTFSVIQKTHHAPDHPATFAEANYLKAIYLEFKTAC
jgi:23S rRNA (cytosine1962-C5)-methyltransferase